MCDKDGARLAEATTNPCIKTFSFPYRMKRVIKTALRKSFHWLVFIFSACSLGEPVVHGRGVCFLRAYEGNGREGSFIGFAGA